jgi:hypothetical protein
MAAARHRIDTRFHESDSWPYDLKQILRLRLED